MKRIKILLIYIAMGIASFTSNVVTDDYKGAFDVVRSYISTNSYNGDMKIDREVSRKMFDKLVDTLDPNKMFLTKEDLKIYKNVRDQYGKLTSNHYIYFGNHLVDRYQEKLKKQYGYAISLVKNFKFNFYSNEYFVPDREDQDYFENNEKLNKEWEKRVLNDVIRLKLTGESNEKIKEILIKRYNSNLKNSLKLTKEEKNQMVINAYSETFDPHNTWFGVDASKEFEISSSLSLVGIGVSIQQRGEGTIIANILKGGPAEKSNSFYPGDQFVYVGEGLTGDLVDVSNYRIKDLVKLIRGKEGTVVRIGVRRNESSPVRIIKLVRETIKQEDEELSSKVINVNNKKVGYVNIPGFYSKALANNEGRNVSDDLRNAIFKLRKENVRSMVIDLRNNGGGSLPEVIKMLGYFVDKGKVAVQVKDENGRVEVYRTNTSKIWDKPLVVMVNRNSASASEIFAGTIKDYERGVIVGNTTWGKGSVQSVQTLKYQLDDTIYDYGLFKYTINMFFRPNGSSTQIKGVEPDIEFFKTDYDKKHGEFKYKNALKWEKIDNRVTNKFKFSKSIKELKRLHQNRINRDPKWQFLLEQNEFVKKYFDSDVLSLNINKRIDERRIIKKKQESFKKKAKQLNIPIETVFVLDDGLSYNEGDIKEQVKREEILKKYIDPQTYEAAKISLDLVY